MIAGSADFSALPVFCCRLRCRLRRFQHVPDADAVARGRVVYENVRHRADELSVLDDGASRHALNDAAGLRQKLGICHRQHDGRALCRGIHLFDLDAVFARFLAAERASYRRLAGLKLAGLERRAVKIGLAEDAAAKLAAKISVSRPAFFNIS